MIYTIIALRVPGLRADSPDGAVGARAARRPADRGRRPGPGAALRLAGLGHGDRHDRAGRRRAARPIIPRWMRAVDWLLDKEVRHRGRLADPPAGASSRPAGTSSSATSSIPTSTTRRWSCWPCSRSPLAERAGGRRRRPGAGVDWLLAMQNRDGGWAAFDVDIDNQVLTKVPFADHNAMLDPSCADITARVLELLGTLGYRADHPAVARALDYLWRTQEPRGLLVRPLGRQLHLRHLAGPAGPQGDRLPDGPPGARQGRRLARVGPAAVGGWGETCRSYDDPTLKGTGEPTASQTAWAVARPDRRRPGATARPSAAASSTCSRPSSPTAPGTKTPFTGTGFPRVFYLQYHLYRVYFPLMAIARYQAAVGQPPASRARGPGQPDPGPAPSRSSHLIQANMRRRDWTALRIFAMRGHAIRPRRTCPGGRCPCDFPLPMTTRIAGYVAKKKLARAKKFPMVLMLEPLHACNLTCTGCGRIREYESTIKQKLSIEECLDAVDECGAPVVSICGGEPMIYPGIGELVAKILERKKVVYPLHQRHVHPQEARRVQARRTRFFFNVHLDGMRKNHDIAVEREGVFDAAIDGIKAAKEAGFLVCTNTTVFKETDMAELDELFAYLTDARRRRLHDLARLQLRGGRRQGDLHDPRRHPGQVPRGRGDVPQVQVQHLADLPGIPPGQARDAVHRLGATRPATSRAGRARAT